MNDLDSEVNKGIVKKKNKARSMHVFEYDFSKFEKDIEQLKSQNERIARAMSGFAEILKSNQTISEQQVKGLSNITSLLGHLTEQKALEVALARKSMREKEFSIEETENYKDVVEALTSKRFITTPEVIGLCKVSKPTATKLMRIIAKNNDNLKYVEHHSTEPARIFKKR